MGRTARLGIGTEGIVMLEFDRSLASKPNQPESQEPCYAPSQAKPKPKIARPSLAKVPTGIKGLDEVTGGGLPKGRITRVCGRAGYGKSLLAMEFLVHGAVEYGEPGVCMNFEETEEKLTANVASLGFDLRDLTKRKKLLMDYVSIERNQIAETGQYNLDGLFIRLAHAVKAIKAKRVILDSVEALFSGIADSAILRSELSRLFRWLEDQKLTAIVTWKPEPTR